MNPLALGADVVMHSAHQISERPSRRGGRRAGVRAPRTRYFERAARTRAMLGAILGPFEAALLLRGHAHAARARASPMRRGNDHRPALRRGIRASRRCSIRASQSHPGHEIAARQMRGGFGGMLSVRVKGGEAAAIAAAANVKLWKRATSLGGVESLIEHRASIEGAGSPCPPDLLRLSVGLESVDDLIGDLEQAIVV